MWFSKNPSLYILMALLVIISVLTICTCKKNTDENTDEIIPETNIETKGDLSADPDAPNDSFLVFVDKVNLREKPSTDSKSLEVLKKGDKIKYLTEDNNNFTSETDDYEWIKVKSQNGTVGWVAIIFTIQENIYAKYKDIISLTIEGKMESAKDLAMKDRLKNENKAMLSPSGNYLLINDYEVIYPAYPTRILFLKKGEGLIGYGEGYFNGFFNFGLSDSEKYLFYQDYSSCPVYGITIIDLTNLKSKMLGICYEGATLSDTSSCEFAPDTNILVYIATDDELNMKYNEDTIPALFAYDPRSDTKTKLMQADLSTFNPETMEISLKTVIVTGSIKKMDMDLIERTDIYQRYLNGEHCKFFKGAG